MTMIPLYSPMYFPEVMAGGPNGTITTNSTTLDAVGEKVAACYQAPNDLTIRNVGWRWGSISGTATDNTLDVRIETVGADGLPTGTLWDTNTNCTHTFTSEDDNSFPTSPGLTADATISQGEWFAVVINLTQIEATRAATIVRNHDDVNLVKTHQTVAVQDIGAGWVVTGSNRAHMFALKESSGDWAFTPDSWWWLTNGYSTVASDGAIKRAGLYFQIPFKCQVNGFKVNWDGDGDGVWRLYDSDGTTVLSSHTWDASKRHNSIQTVHTRIYFDDNVTLEANTNYRLTFDSSETTSSSLVKLTLPSNDQLDVRPAGKNWYLTEHNGTSWTETNTVVPIMELGIIAIDFANTVVQSRR